MIPFISKKALQQAYNYGLSEVGCKEKLLSMFVNAAPVTHPKGNRRFNEWILHEQKGVVISVHLIQCQQCEDKLLVMVFDDCGKCNGTGRFLSSQCRVCHGQGELKNFIRCPACS